jgi:hypothetical protein
MTAVEMPPDMLEAIRDADFDMLEAYYLYCSFYHGGQWTDEYKWLSHLTSSGFKISPLRTIENASEEVKALYNMLCWRYQPDDAG